MAQNLINQLFLIIQKLKAFNNQNTSPTEISTSNTKFNVERNRDKNGFPLMDKMKNVCLLFSI
jgi:hypothetical protein